MYRDKLNGLKDDAKEKTHTWRKAIEKDLDAHSRQLPNKELHERINNKVKSQNESVSINELRARLLIEASELLGE